MARYGGRLKYLDRYSSLERHLLIQSQSRTLQNIPHFPGAERNIDVPYTNMGQRVDDGIDDGLRRSNGRRLTDTLGSNGMMRRRRDRLIRFPVRRFHRGGNEIVLEVASQDVAVLIEGHLLVHGRSESLCQATVNLPFDHHRVDDRAAVIYGHKAPDMYLPGATVDVHDTDVAAKWVCQVGRIIVVDCFQAWLQVRWTVGVGGKGQFLNGLAFAGRALHEETSRLPLQVILTYL